MLLISLALIGALLSSCSGTATDTTVLSASTSTTTGVAPTTAPSTTTTTTGSVGGVDPSVAAALRTTIEDLMVATENIRGLDFKEDPIITIVTEDELAARVRKLIEDELDPEETARDERLMKLLGILDPSADLAALYGDLYSEQVAGYYDGETDELVVPATDDDLTGLQRLTMVHELTHALTDQYFDFHDLGDILDEEERFEEGGALQALVEGDATFVEALFFNTALSSSEQAAIFDEFEEVETSVFDSAPSFMTDLLVFPYNRGAAFVGGLWQSGRFEAVNAAYDDPPLTTEQIIHPALYQVEDAVAVDLPDTPVDGYENAEESVWGQLGLEALFSQSLGSIADNASRGWGGDRYRVLWDGERVVFVLSWVGDESADADEMMEAWQALIDEQMPPDSYVFVGRSGDSVVFIAADDPDAGASVRGAFADFAG